MIAVLSTGAFGLEAAAYEDAGSSDLNELPETSQSLLEFAGQALAYVEENGKQRALEEFNYGTDLFVTEDRYIIAFGFDGTCLAHPFRPEMVGEDHTDFRDVNGVLLNRNLNDVASRGGGFTYYVRPNAQKNDTPELKLSYIAKVDDEWWLGTGVWLPEVSAVFSAESRLALVDLVDEAAAYAQENGREKALEAFGDRDGEFVDGNRYIFAYDFDGRVLAHPIQPELVGEDRSEEPDHYGAHFIRDLMDAAEEGTGLVYYSYPDPAKKMTPSVKLGYVRAVDEEWWLGSEIYINEIGEVEEAESSHQPPASKEELAAFVESAASYTQIFGRDLATKDFMNLEGPFVRGDVYIFAADFNGTSLALPYLPSAVGTNRLDLQNSEGVRINREMRSIAENRSGFFEYLWTNPISGETEPKTSYVTKVDDVWWLGAGIYLEGEERAADA
ncbi:cache domain-containing protein [Methanocrinis sp.]|uniref:cache domain-containing protein n=1 Tax=Methanocrinis sp. TaxID=3101522 RepID=UPI003D0D6D41